MLVRPPSVAYSATTHASRTTLLLALHCSAPVARARARAPTKERKRDSKGSRRTTSLRSLDTNDERLVARSRRAVGKLGENKVATQLPRGNGPHLGRRTRFGLPLAVHRGWWMGCKSWPRVANTERGEQEEWVEPDGWINWKKKDVGGASWLVGRTRLGRGRGRLALPAAVDHTHTHGGAEPVRLRQRRGLGQWGQGPGGRQPGSPAASQPASQPSPTQTSLFHFSLGFSSVVQGARARWWCRFGQPLQHPPPPLLP